MKENLNPFVVNSSFQYQNTPQQIIYCFHDLTKSLRSNPTYIIVNKTRRVDTVGRYGGICGDHGGDIVKV